MEDKLASKFGLTRIDAIVCATTTEEDATMDVRTFLSSDSEELEEWKADRRRAGFQTFATTAVELTSNDRQLFAKLKIANEAVAKARAERDQDRRTDLIREAVKALIEGFAFGTAAWAVFALLNAIPTN